MKIPYYRRGPLPKELVERFASLDEEGQSLDGELERFETKIAEAVSAPYALGTSSSTAALHLAMCALDLKRGDKVLCPVNAFVDVPEVVRHFDAEPIFVDSDPRSYNLDLGKLEEALDRYNHKKLRAVVVHHLAGLPVDLERVWELAKEYNVEIIEDATHALGARYRGRPIGSFSENLLTIFSLGEKCGNHYNAGVLCTHNSECRDRADLLRNHGMVENRGDLHYLYDVLEPGCQYRLSDYDASYAQVLFEKVEERNRRHREIAEFYRKELSGLRHLRLPVESDEHLYSRFIVEIDRNRDAFARELLAKGIEVNLHYVPLHITRYYKEKYGLKIFDYPNAMGSYQRVMSLPNRPELSEEELAYVCESIRQIDARHI